jgi:hypothetical protein
MMLGEEGIRLPHAFPASNQHRFNSSPPREEDVLMMELD